MRKGSQQRDFTHPTNAFRNIPTHPRNPLLRSLQLRPLTAWHHLGVHWKCMTSPEFHCCRKMAPQTSQFYPKLIKDKSDSTWHHQNKGKRLTEEGWQKRAETELLFHKWVHLLLRSKTALRAMRWTVNCFQNQAGQHDQQGWHKFLLNMVYFMQY